jgi:hypothetical protein
MSGLIGGKRTQINNTETALGAMQVQNSAQGLPIPIVYGTTRITGNNIWYGDFTAVPHTDTQSSGGGKGGGGGVTITTTTYTYTTGVAIGLCEGPIGGIGQIWEQKNVTTAAALGLTEFTGSYAQAPWSYLTSNHPSEALGYRGIAYVATAAYQLGNSGSLPNLSFEIHGKYTTGSIAWTSRTSVANNTWRAIAWNGSIFVAVSIDGAGNRVMTSPDGVTWTSRASAADNQWLGVCWGNGLFVAVANTGATSRVMTSPDGINWTARTGILDRTWLSVAWNGSVFVAVANGSTWAFGVLDSVMTSPDGVTWTLRNAAAASQWLSVVWADTLGLFVAVANAGAGNRVMTSPDGVTWTGRSAAAANAWRAVTWGNSLLVAVSSDGAGNRVMTSPDGINWTIRSSLSSGDGTWTSVAYGNGRFVAVGYGFADNTMYSADGVTWTAVSPAESSYYWAVCSAGPLFVAVGQGPGTGIMTSTFVMLGSDVNPESVISDLLTNVNYGAGFPSAQLGSLTAFSSYCAAAGIAISPAYTAQRTAMDIATELCQIGNSAPFWSEGMLKVTPYADAAVGAFTPDTTVQYQLTDDDFLGDPPVKVLRKRPADAYNSLVVQCKDRANNYNNATPAADDQASIDRYGPRPMPMITFDAICVPAIGRKVAQNILTRALYYPNTYEFTLGWKYSRLEAMDLVGLTDAAVGLNQTTVRILTIEEDEDGNLRMTAEDFNPGVSNSATYGTQASGGYIVNQAAAPGDANAPVIFQPSLALSGTPEAWLGTSGGADWGGAEVWLSSDNTTYTKFGTITAPARHGVLSAPLAVGADPDSVNTLAVDLTVSAGALITVPPAQADALITLCYVDGELLAYKTATLTSAYHYDLTYLRRGQYWSKSAAHSAGTKFMRLDDAVFKAACPESWVGSTIYVKLLSFNKAGGGLQSLADVSPTTFVVQPVQVSTQNGFVYDTITANQDLYIPANTVYTVSGRLTNHGRITCVGRLRITN